MEPKVTKQNVPQDKRSLQLMHTLCSLLASHSARIARLQTHSGPLNIVSLENVLYQINTHLHSGNLHYYNYSAFKLTHMTSSNTCVENHQKQLVPTCDQHLWMVRFWEGHGVEAGIRRNLARGEADVAYSHHQGLATTPWGAKQGLLGHLAEGSDKRHAGTCRQRVDSAFVTTVTRYYLV